MKNKLILLSIIGVILLFIPGVSPLKGQTWLGRDLEDKWRQAAWKIGPFRIQPILFLSNAGFDSNIYGSPENPVPDYSFSTGPGFNVYLPIRRKILFSLYESPQYVYFLETERERTWNNYFNAQVHFIFTRFLFSFGKELANVKQRVSTETDLRPRIKSDNLQGSVLWQYSKKTSFSLKLKQIRYYYENLQEQGLNLKARLNREERFLNLVGYYQRSSKIKYFVDLEYGFYNFDNPQSLNDTYGYGVYFGFDASPLSRVKGSLKLGYKYFDPVEPGRESYGGIVGDTSLSIRLTKILSARVVYKRDLPFSILFSDTYVIWTTYGGGISLYLFKDIRLDYDYTHGTHKYPELEIALAQEPVSDQNISRRYNHEMHSFGLNFRLKKNIGAGIHGGQWKWSYASVKSDRFFIAISLTYDF